MKHLPCLLTESAVTYAELKIKKWRNTILEPCHCKVTLSLAHIRFLSYYMSTQNTWLSDILTNRLSGVFTSLDIVVGSLPVLWAIALKVIHFDKQDCISILSSKVMCLFFLFSISPGSFLNFPDWILPLNSSHTKFHRNFNCGIYFGKSLKIKK